MKKTLITTAIAFSAAGFAFAQDATVTPTASVTAAATVSADVPPVLAPMATGDVKIDDQLRALQKEMEARIKAIREEYQSKIKVIIGNRKAFVASSTQAIKQEKKEMKEENSAAVKALQQDFEARKKILQQEYEAKRKAAATASSTESSRKALNAEFETKMKLLQQDFEIKKKALIASSTQAIHQEVETKKTELRQEVRGTSTENPQGNAWGFFRRFFGQLKPATTSDNR